MLLCYNCGALQASATPACLSCHMPGSLAPKPQLQPEKESEREIHMLSCPNCASETSAEESKCSHCSFPLPNNTLRDSSGKQLPLVKRIRQTG